MALLVKGINPEILRWARVRSGLSLEETAAALGKDADFIAKWESGEAAPTYVQLESLAYRLYKRPIAIFFFPEPPQEPEPARSFRTLPQFELEHLSSDTLYAIREARAMQITLLDLNDGINPAPRIIFRDLIWNQDTDPKKAAEKLRSYLNIPLGEQVGWDTYDEALKQWRNCIQKHGVFIFKRSFKEKDISGFCLIDAQFPVIYLNNGTSFSRQIFSLFHELAHLLIRSNSISKLDPRYIDDLPLPDQAIEKFCDRLAAEFLVPSHDFDHLLRQQRMVDMDFAEKTALRYLVSREVIARRLKDLGKITPGQYREWTAEWSREARRDRTGGGNYYATQASYLGEAFIKLAFGKYYQGSYSLEQLADYLNMKATSVPGLEHFVFG